MRKIIEKNEHIYTQISKPFEKVKNNLDDYFEKLAKN